MVGLGVRLGLHRPVVSAGGGGGGSYLDSVVASTCCDLDATISDSYGGTGQTWSNLTASPSDGAAQADYDFWLGLDGTVEVANPTFTGTAGDTGAYWSMDGGDYFGVKSFSDALTLYNAHKSGASGSQFWIAIAYFANGVSAKAGWGSSWIAGDIGVYGFYDSNGSRRLYRGTSSALDNANESALANDWDGTVDDVLVIVSADMTATTNNVRIWTTSSTSQLISKDFGTNTETANNTFLIGATADSTTSSQGRLLSGAKVYSFAAGDAFLTDAQAADIASHLGTRHGRTYY